MQKMKKKRKGFTLTELAIVIAVIAILIAVLVPTFVSLINSANESADQQAVKSMNTVLATHEATDGTPDSASDAMNILKEEGYNVGNYVAFSSENTIYYDKVVNRCLIWTVTDDSASVTYPSDLASKYEGVTGIAASWYTLSEACNTVEADASNFSIQLTSALSDGGTTIISISEDVALTSAISNTDAQVTLELNGYTLSVSSTNTSSMHGMLSADGEEATIYISGGAVSYTGNTNKKVYMVEAKNGAAVTMENVTMTSDNQVWSGLWAGDEATQINIIDSTIEVNGVYGIQTNAENNSEHSGVAINIENSNISVTASSGDCASILLNIEGTLNISDSTIKGQRQGIIVRAGTANITNTTISCSITSKQVNTGSSNEEYMAGRTNYTQSWGNGNRVALAAVIVGNNTNSGYEADAVLTMSGCTLTYDITDISSDDSSTKIVTSDNVEQYEISLYMIANSANGWSTSVTATNCTYNNKVVCLDMSSQTAETNHNCTCDYTLNGYTGTVYTKWNNSAWE